MQCLWLGLHAQFLQFLWHLLGIYRGLIGNQPGHSHRKGKNKFYLYCPVEKASHKHMMLVFYTFGTNRAKYTCAVNTGNNGGFVSTTLYEKVVSADSESS